MYHNTLETIEKDMLGVSISDEEVNKMREILKIHPYNDGARVQIHFKKSYSDSNPEQLMVFYNVDGRSYDRMLKHRGFSPCPIASRQMTVLEWCEIAGAFRMTYFKYHTWYQLIDDELKYIDARFRQVLLNISKKYHVSKEALKLVNTQTSINFFQP